MTRPPTYRKPQYRSLREPTYSRLVHDRICILTRRLPEMNKDDATVSCLTRLPPFCLQVAIPRWNESGKGREGKARQGESRTRLLACLAVTPAYPTEEGESLESFTPSSGLASRITRITEMLAVVNPYFFTSLAAPSRKRHRHLPSWEV